MIQRLQITDIDQKALQSVQIDPATQIDDLFDYSKVVVRKPWGYEYLMYQNGLVAVWILYIKPGFRTSMHCHPGKKTSLVVLSGEAWCSNLQQQMKRTAGEGLLIDKGVFHCTESCSEEGIFVMEIETPINKRDLIRLKDHYGRVGQGYESVKEMSFNLQNYNYMSLIDSTIHYNAKRRFGTCSLVLAKFTNYTEFKNNFQRQNWDALSILKGRVLDKNHHVLLDVGDTMDIEKINAEEDIAIDGELEIIAIKKQDRLVKVSDYVISLLEKEKIKDVFIVPGSTNIHLLDSVGRNTNVRHFTTQTEQAATMAAEAYAQLTGTIAVAIIPSGSSGISAITAIANAWVDSTPLLIISGQARSDQVSLGTVRQLGIQEVDFISMVTPLTKYAIRIQDPNMVRYHLEKAISLSRNGRPGPVWIDLPIDIQGMDIHEDELEPFSVLPEPRPADSGTTVNLNPNHNLNLKRAVAETVSLLKSAQRPVILAGNGIRLAKAEEDFLKFINTLSLPVLTSRRGADVLPEDHPLFFGRPGAYGQRSANFMIQNCDLLLSIGSRLSLTLIGRNYQTFARGARKIIVDIDERELHKKTIVPDLAIHASADQFLKEMNRQLDPWTPSLTETEKKREQWWQDNFITWRQRCYAWKEKYARENFILEPGAVNPYTFIRVLARELAGGEIICVDGGFSNILMMQAFTFKTGQRLISATGLENTCFALPAALGCCIASNGKDIICIGEELSLQKNISELGTLVKHQLPVKIFVLNTSGHSYVRESQREYFGGRYVASENEPGFTPQLSKIGKAYNLPTLTINDDAELVPMIRQVLAATGPIICDLNINKKQQIVPRITFTVKPDGKWVSKPLEDMYPFLNREEFKKNMIVDIIDEE